MLIPIDFDLVNDLVQGYAMESVLDIVSEFIMCETWTNIVTESDDLSVTDMIGNYAEWSVYVGCGLLHVGSWNLVD